MTADQTTPDDDRVEESFDPFDMKALRANPPSIAVTESVLLGITARKPKKDEFFRVNPDAGMTVDCHVLEFEGGDNRKVDYFVPPVPVIINTLGEVAPSSLKPVRMFVCLSKFGTLFVWPARLPDERAQKWYTTALNGANEAMTTWVRLQADMRAGMYNLSRAVDSELFGEPEWPDAELSELLRLAFPEDQRITSVDHPVIRELRGQAS
jgi:hypothetical protein